MAKVIMFSQVFPGYHPRAGQSTFFPAKILQSFFELGIKQEGSHPQLTGTVEFFPKHHTIRAGYRWGVGDKFSPRIWSDKPYRSKQIILGPDITVKKVWDIDLKWDEDVDEVDVRLNGKWWCQLGSIESERLAKNDGLSVQDMKAWFRIKPDRFFEGQIICWNEKVDY